VHAKEKGRALCQRNKSHNPRLARVCVAAMMRAAAAVAAAAVMCCLGPAGAVPIPRTECGFNAKVSKEHCVCDEGFVW